MPTQYTVWSHGRLIGETDLAFVRCIPLSRMGWFHPNALGERLMPFACGVSPAMRRFGNLVHQLRPNPHSPLPKGLHLDDLLRGTTEYADAAAAQAQREGLELELRGPKGIVIPTEHIGIQDTHYLLSIPDREISPYEVEFGNGLDPETEAQIEAEVEDWFAELEAEGEGDDWRRVAVQAEPEVEFPRYQIIVRLLNEMDVP